MRFWDLTQCAPLPLAAISQRQLNYQPGALGNRPGLGWQQLAEVPARGECLLDLVTNLEAVKIKITPMPAYPTRCWLSCLKQWPRTSTAVARRYSRANWACNKYSSPGDRWSVSAGGWCTSSAAFPLSQVWNSHASAHSTFDKEGWQGVGALARRRMQSGSATESCRRQYREVHRGIRRIASMFSTKSSVSMEEARRGDERRGGGHMKRRKGGGEGGRKKEQGRREKGDGRRREKGEGRREKEKEGEGKALLLFESLGRDGSPPALHCCCCCCCCCCSHLLTFFSCSTQFP